MMSEVPRVNISGEKNCKSTFKWFERVKIHETAPGRRRPILRIEYANTIYHTTLHHLSINVACINIRVLVPESVQMPPPPLQEVKKQSDRNMVHNLSNVFNQAWSLYDVSQVLALLKVIAAIKPFPSRHIRLFD